MSDAKKQEGSWRDLPFGLVMSEPRSARHYMTGDWRSALPVTDPEKCCNCGLCWVFCPDMCRFRNEKTGAYDVNKFYCKGCGLCARECPTGAIVMIEEET